MSVHCLLGCQSGFAWAVCLSVWAGLAWAGLSGAVRLGLSAVSRHCLSGAVWVRLGLGCQGLFVCHNCCLSFVWVWPGLLGSGLGFHTSLGLSGPGLSVCLLNCLGLPPRSGLGWVHLPLSGLSVSLAGSGSVRLPLAVNWAGLLSAGSAWARPLLGWARVWALGCPGWAGHWGLGSAWVWLSSVVCLATNCSVCLLSGLGSHCSTCWVAWVVCLSACPSQGCRLSVKVRCPLLQCLPGLGCLAAVWAGLGWVWAGLGCSPVCPSACLSGCFLGLGLGSVWVACLGCLGVCPSPVCCLQLGWVGLHNHNCWAGSARLGLSVCPVILVRCLNCLGCHWAWLIGPLPVTMSFNCLRLVQLGQFVRLLVCSSLSVCPFNLSGSQLACLSCLSVIVINNVWSRLGLGCHCHY